MRMCRIIVWTISMFTLISSVMAQSTISGTITDAVDNTELIGVTVLEEGTTNGTITDVSGFYELKLIDDASNIIISYVGYSGQTVSAAGRSTIDIALGLEASELDEIVVVGYGTQKKKVVTGAISKVSAKDLEDMPIVRIESALQGRTSGVRVTTNSGAPGEGGTVRVRGTTSINNSEPLYVVDGVPIGGGIDYLSQGDIESIEVLKDAASASIYGARAANGVILVTTKTGSIGQMEVNYNAYYGVQAPWKKLSLLDAREYGILMNESSVASGGDILFDDPESLGVGTDWQDEVFRTDAPMQNHDISLSAGTEKSNYYVSFGYFDQDGIVSQNNSNYKRYTARFNSSHQISDHVKFGNTLAYTRIKATGVSTNSEFGSPLSRAINLDPITPLIETDPDVLNSSVFQNFEVVRNAEGQPYGISNFVTSEVLNPVAAFQTQQGFGWSDKIVASIYGEVSFLNGFKFRSSFGADLAFFGGEGFAPIYYLNATNRNDITRYNRSQNKGLKWIIENTLSYTKTIDVHSISAVIGTVSEQNKGQGIGGSIQDIPVNRIEDASLAFPTTAESQTFFGFEYLNTQLSYLSRINYNYNQKYLFSATMRVDGSSRFGANNRFGFFPAVSLGWILTEENFLYNNPVINFAKVRASWGVNGNDQIGDFRFVSTVGGARNYVFGLEDRLVNGVSPNAIANPDLRWEQTTQINVGIDAKLFRRLSLTLDLFQKITDDMLLDIAVPGYVGNAGPVGNIASLSNKGVEVELGYNNKVGGLSYDISGNVSYNKNEITNLGADKEFLPGQTFSPQGLELSRSAVGMPIGFFYGFQTDGIFQNAAEVAAYTNADGIPIQPDAQPGDFRFVDVNDDGILDPDDRTMIGDPTPSWTYGVNLSLGWNNFDLVMFGQGVAGNDIFKATRRFDLQMANLTSDALGRWTGEGTTNDYARLSMNDPNKNFSRSSDFYVEDGSFFRIKTLQIGYTIPQSIMDRAGLNRIRVYVSGNNLLTITQYSGFDPEIGGGSFGVDRGIYPQPRFFLFGINGTF